MHIFGTTPLGNQNWLKISRPRKHLISTSAITEFHYTNNNQIKILITSWFFLLLTYEQIAIFPGNESKVKYERKTSNVNTLCPHGCQSKINNRTTSHLGREMYAYTGFINKKKSNQNATCPCSTTASNDRRNQLKWACGIPTACGILMRGHIHKVGFQLGVWHKHWTCF